MGYSKGGAIVKMLSNTAATLSEMETLAINMLNTIGITVPKAILGEGDIDANSAMENYFEIINITNGNVAEVYREAAKLLVYGTENFDPCAVPGDTMGPFMPQCIQREFRKAGCQPAGEDYPGKAEMLGKFSGYKWSEVKREFSELYASMKSADGDVQDEAVKKCLGVKAVREPPKPCKKKWTSRYNDKYFCEINTVEIKNGEAIIGYAAQGDMSLGPLQEATHSKLMAGNTFLKLNGTARSVAPGRDSGHLFYTLPDSLASLPLSFTYGFEGYSKVTLV
jgi:hypothetical protein